MSCENDTIPMKTNSSVRLNCRYTEDDEVTPIDLTGYAIDADFIAQKTGTTLKSCSTVDGSINITDAALGEYTINAGVSTDWPLGRMPVDILYTKTGDSNHTEDFFLDFTEGRTVADSLPESGA